MGVTIRRAPVRDGTCSDDDGADECRRASRRRGIYLAAIIVAASAAVVWVVAGFVACAVTSVCLSATMPGSAS